MRRKRHQRGSLQRVKQGSRFMWVVKYYDMDGRRRQTTLGQAARMTKAEAQVERERFMATINEDAAERLSRRDPPMLGEFIAGRTSVQTAPMEALDRRHHGRLN